MSKAAGMTTRPTRRFPEYTESDPAIHGRTEPPNPHKDKTQRESEESRASAKNCASNRGKMGPRAAPRTTIATTWRVVALSPSNALPAATPTMAAMRSRREEFMRSSSSEEIPRDPRKPHQYREDAAAARAAPVLAVRRR